VHAPDAGAQSLARISQSIESPCEAHVWEDRLMRVGKICVVVGILAIAAVAGWAASDNSAGSQGPGQSIARGRYVVVIGGCNDCHTAGFAESGGTLPEREWLVGNPVGWRGPWGTTYAINLRLLFQTMSEDGWVSWARTSRTLPPMPYWILNAMQDEDLRAMYQFIRSLGPAGVPAPVDLPPGQTPTTPFVQFPGAP